MRKITLIAILLSAVILVFLKAGIVAAEPAIKLLQPRSFPYALAVVTETPVTFKVHVVNETTESNPKYVLLQQANGPEPYKLNDLGKAGDKFAGDGIYGGTINVRTPEQAGECLQYFASAVIGKTALESPAFSLCATSLPIGFAESNTKPDNL